MSTSLYIVGNGFDIHHGIPSRYCDFGLFLKKVDLSTYREVERYFTVDGDFWNEFEAHLADLDVYALIEYAGNFLVPYGAEDWSDSGHHDYQYEIDRVVEAISTTMNKHFAAWIRELPIPTNANYRGKLLPLDPTASRNGP